MLVVQDRRSNSNVLFVLRLKLVISHPDLLSQNSQLMMYQLCVLVMNFEKLTDTASKLAGCICSFEGVIQPRFI